MKKVTCSWSDLGLMEGDSIDWSRACGRKSLGLEAVTGEENGSNFNIWGLERDVVQIWTYFWHSSCVGFCCMAGKKFILDNPKKATVLHRPLLNTHPYTRNNGRNRICSQSSGTRQKVSIFISSCAICWYIYKFRTIKILKEIFFF